MPEQATPEPEGTATADELHVLHAGGENSLKSLFDPWDPACGDIAYIPYYFYAVRHRRGLVLIDCGAHPDLALDPVRRLGEQAQFSDIVMDVGDDVVGCLRRAGLDPADVTDIVITHLHFDHCGGLELLPHARVHVQQAEWDFAADPPVYQQLAYIPADWAQVQRWMFHQGEHDLFGDGAITLFPTPGHTPGHQSVLVRLAGRTALCVGDAAYHPMKMAERKLPAYLWSPDALIASWEQIEHLRDRHDAELLFSHYPGPDELAQSPAPFTAASHRSPMSPAAANQKGHTS